jgi:hypothetical protein
MNEPQTNAQKPDPALLVSMDQRAINAIRAVDPDKIIAVGGDFGSGPDQLAGVKISDNNILYTFHWYYGSGGNEDFIGETKQDSGIAGTHDWVKIEKTVQIPPKTDHMSIVVRSTYNTGSAWQSVGFDQNPQGYHPEALPETMSYDPSAGHDKPGSLKVHASIENNDWAGWVSERLPVKPGQTYHISTWVKLDQATGDTFLNIQFFRSDTVLDPVAFKEKIIPAVEFAQKYNVPVWVGEFGCDTSIPDLQPKWVSACISLFEKKDFNWTYWNDKSTDSPSGMSLQAEHPDGSDYPVNERLLTALRAGWALNQPF